MIGLGATDPQTWNRYAYVRNNPLALRDPTGEVICQGGEDEDSSDSGGECDEDGPGSLFGQASSGLWDWVSSGPAQDPSPFQGYYPIFGNEFDSLEKAVTTMESPAYQVAAKLLVGAVERDIRILQGT